MFGNTGGTGLFSTPQSGLGRGLGLNSGTSTGGGLFNRQSGGLFGNPGTQPGGIGSSGGGLFGQTPASQTGGGLFGGGGLGGGGGLSGNTSGLFQTPQTGGLATQQKGLFGSPMLGGSSSGSNVLGSGLLGQTSTGGGGLFNKPQTSGTGLMGGGLGGGLGSGIVQSSSGLFGGIGGGSSGTTAKYEPTKGTDTVNKNGLNVTISTLHHCITASASYMNKSLEELRFEDYCAGRKGPTMGTSGTLGSGGLFGGGGLGGGTSMSGGGLFGQNKPLGAGNTLGGGILGGAQNQGQLGLGGLGTNTATSGGLFGNQQKLGGTGGGLFGNNTLGGGAGILGGQSQAQLGAGLGGTSTSGGLFGNQQKLGGGGGLFGNTSTQNKIGGLGATGGGLFGQQQAGGTQLGTGLGGGTQLGAGGLGGGNLFNRNPGLGQTGGLGQTQTGGGLNFGLSGLSGLGGGTTGLNVGGGGLGATGLGANKIGNTLAGTGGGGIGLGSGLAGLGQTNLVTNSLQQQQQQQLQLKQQQLEVLASSPFGDSSLFRTALYDESKLQKKATPTSVTPKTSPGNMPHYKLSLRPSAKLTTTSLSSPARHREKSRLFEGLDSPQSATPTLSGGGSLGMSIGGSSGDAFVPRQSVKKLNIRPKPSQSHGWTDSSTPPVEDAAPSPIQPVKSGVGDKPLKRSPLREEVAEDMPLAARDGSYIAKPRAGGGATSWSQAATKDGSFVAIAEEEREEEVETRRCGVVLSDPSYYTIPSLDECDSITANGACVVTNFTIGRQEFGEIHFPGNTDIYGLNLDKIVKIESREVVVYPDDLPEPKPAVGEELNKRAIVSMHGFWPKDKQTHTPIKDKERLQRMNYTKKLEGLVEKIGGTFVDYKCEKGTCEFEVQHFSKYRLDGDDSDDDDEGGDGAADGGKGGQAGHVGVTKKPRTAAAQASRESVPLLPVQPVPVHPLPVHPLPAQPIPPAPVTSAGDESMSGGEEEEFEDAYEEMGSAAVASQQLPLAPPQQLVGPSTQHIQLMKMSFFSKDEERHKENYPPKGQAVPHSPSLIFPTVQPTPQRTPRASMLYHKQATPMRSPAVPSPASAPMSAPLQHPSLSLLTPQRFQQPPSSPARHASSSSSSVAQSAILMSKRDLRTLVPAKDSLQTNNERCLCDHGLFLGRSFRVGWGPNWTLVHSGRQMSSPSAGRVPSQGSLFSRRLPSSNSSKDDPLPIRVVVEKLACVTTECDKFEPFLSAQLEKTDFQYSLKSNAPFCSPVSGTSVLASLSEVACAQRLNPPILPPATKDREEVSAWRQLERVLQLLVVLWGDLSSDISSDPDDYAHQMTRKQRVSQWLRETNKSVTEEEVIPDPKSEDQYLQSLYSLVAGQQIGAACKLAQKKKDYKLSLILSQAATPTETTKVLLRKQLEMWDQHGAHRYIHQVRLKLFVLLAGTMKWTWTNGSLDFTSDRRDEPMETNTSEGLDWKRSLALHLSYGSELSSHLSDTLGQYTDAFQMESPPYAPPPYPPHLERESGTHGSSDAPYDTCYHLLRLYCERNYPMENVLQPTASSASHTDYRTCWMVWSVLSALGYSHMHKTTEAQLIMGVANQLATCGKWQWSVFAVLHLSDPVLRRSAVEDILSRHCSPEKELQEDEVFVLEKLHVPSGWVYGAKAQQASYEQWHDLTAAHLLRSGQWNEAHVVVLEHLAVDAIVNGDSKELLRMLKTLKDHESQVFGWDEGGSVFLDYLFISDKFHELMQSQSEPSFTDYDLESLLMGLKLLAGRIGLLPANSPRHVLCQSEIAKQTLNFTRAVVQLKAASMKMGNDYIVDELGSCLKQVPLPPDLALTEYRSLLPLGKPTQLHDS